MPSTRTLAPGVTLAASASGRSSRTSTGPAVTTAITVPGQGTVTRVYPAVQAGQVAADVEMAGLDSRLIGRRLPAHVAAGTRHAMLVPKGFVTTRFGLDSVTVVARDGTALHVPVQTTPADDGQVEILSGVNPGDVLAGAAQ